MNPPQWAAQRRFVPVHLNTTHASSFSTSEVPAAKTSFVGKNLAQSTVPVGNDPPPTASLKSSKSNFEPQPDSSFQQEPEEKGGFPVIVFGMPTDQRHTLVDHFTQFGELTVVDNNNIECGRNYLRLVYTTRAAAQRALAENGQLGPGGYMLGCVSESKDLPVSAGSNSASGSGTFSSGGGLIKVLPGSSLFKQAEPAEKAPDGWTTKIFNGLTTAIFGVGDL